MRDGRLYLNHSTGVGQKWLEDYAGRKVRLTDERLSHILEHPVCVAVKLEQNDAFILTAYLMRKPVGGRQLWPRRN